MPTKAITNEDIQDNLQDLMQLTSEGFDGLNRRMNLLEGRMGGIEGRMDGLEGEMGGLAGRMDKLERQYTEIKVTVDQIAGEQKAQTNDIKEILDRLLAIEKRLPNITEDELREMQDKLEKVIVWAKTIAKKEGITLKV